MKENEVKRCNNNIIISEFRQDRRIILMNMINYIEKDNFKHLYHIIYIILSIFLTNILQELIFSIITRFLHHNMNIETCITKLKYKLNFSVSECLVKYSN